MRSLHWQARIPAAAVILLYWGLGASTFALAQHQNQTAAPADVTLEGTIDGSQNQSYVKVPFTVSAGTWRVTIEFDYTGREQHTALDLGLLDSTELRCWSGGNKSVLTVGPSDATPSCLARFRQALGMF